MLKGEITFSEKAISLCSLFKTQFFLHVYRPSYLQESKITVTINRCKPKNWEQGRGQVLINLKSKN